MSYYQGDFYQGDPGFGLMSVIKGGIGLARRIFRHPSAPALPPIGGFPGGAMTIPSRIGRVIRQHPVISAAGGAAILGGISRGVRRGAPGEIPGMRRRRRMRVTNPKALRRAIRRAQGFSKLARKVLHFTSPRAPRGRPVFKRKRSKRVC